MFTHVTWQRVLYVALCNFGLALPLPESHWDLHVWIPFFHSWYCCSKLAWEDSACSVTRVTCRKLFWLSLVSHHDLSHPGWLWSPAYCSFCSSWSWGYVGIFPVCHTQCPFPDTLYCVAVSLYSLNSFIVVKIFKSSLKFPIASTVVVCSWATLRAFALCSVFMCALEHNIS